MTSFAIDGIRQLRCRVIANNKLYGRDNEMGWQLAIQCLYLFKEILKLILSSFTLV